MDSTLIELVEQMQVRVNIMEEEKRQQEFYNKGVEAMRLAKGTDSSDFAIGKWERVVELHILREAE